MLFFLAMMAAALAAYVGLSPAGDPSKATITVVTSAPTLDKYLEMHRDALGTDYTAYRNHNLRVLSYALHIGGDSVRRDVAEAALAFHDIGLWTDDALAYLEPSSKRAMAELAADFSPLDLELINTTIMLHHKVTPYEGPGAATVNAVRKGDWVDASKGLVPHGIPADDRALVDMQLPNAGFHRALAGFGPKLHGANVPRIVWELASIFRI